MKTKHLIIIFILFLLTTLGGGAAVFLIKEKDQIADDGPSAQTEKPVQPIISDAAEATAPPLKQIVEPEKIAIPELVSASAEEKIKVVMIINGVKYEAGVKPGSSVYDLMNLLKVENKIDFKGKNYLELGFFIEEINGEKNNPIGKNWVYYINGRPAQAGVSNYLIKADDIIEWKYEKKSFWSI